jgi:hypothetical protein
MDRQEIIDAIKTARQITDKSMPFEANVAQSDVTALRVAAFTAVLGKLLGNAAEYGQGPQECDKVLIVPKASPLEHPHQDVRSTGDLP